jgi:hypothetical protein
LTRAAARWHDRAANPACPLTTVRSRAFLYTEATRGSQSQLAAWWCVAVHRTRRARGRRRSPRDAFLGLDLLRQSRSLSIRIPWWWFALVARDPGRARELVVGFAAGAVDTDQTRPQADAAGFNQLLRRAPVCWLETQSASSSCIELAQLVRRGTAGGLCTHIYAWCVLGAAQ